MARRSAWPAAALLLAALSSHRAMAQSEASTAPAGPLKGIALNGDGSWFVDLGGELRERVESARQPVFGLAAPATNAAVLQRLLLSADVHYGPEFRGFLQLVSAFAPGWNGAPPATQRDPLDLAQGFGELGLKTAGGDIQLRAGRQEISFGSSRLVSVRDSPNVRRAFDGLRAAWMSPGPSASDLRIDGFLVRPVAPQAGSFNDGSDPAQAFWGLYATGAVPGVAGLKADLYYLGLTRRDARFAQGMADEHRHTVGTRLFGKRAGFDWNIEGAFQFGGFGGAAIRAWTVSSDLGYSPAGWPLAPRLGLNADAISGDGNPRDRQLGTFNPLFPRLPYFSEANLAAPANLLDVQPTLTLVPAAGLTATIGWNPLWKEAKADAFYAPPLVAVKGTAGGTGRFLGQQVSGTLGWSAGGGLQIGGSYVHYTPAGRLRQAGGRAGDFAAAWARFLF